MPFINVKLIEGVFSPEQKQQIVRKLTDAMVSIEGEAMRGVTWTVIEEVKSGDWAIGGRPLTTSDVLALAATPPADGRVASSARFVDEPARWRRTEEGHGAEERHDYVVVGAGTSGIALAYLLHKHGKDVVVLEAGEDKDDDPNIHDLKSFYGLESHYRNEYFWPENGRPNRRLPGGRQPLFGRQALGWKLFHQRGVVLARRAIHLRPMGRPVCR